MLGAPVQAALPFRLVYLPDKHLWLPVKVPASPLTPKAKLSDVPMMLSGPVFRTAPGCGVPMCQGSQNVPSWRHFGVTHWKIVAAIKSELSMVGSEPVLPGTTELSVSCMTGYRGNEPPPLGSTLNGPGCMSVFTAVAIISQLCVSPGPSTTQGTL